MTSDRQLLSIADDMETLLHWLAPLTLQQSRHPLLLVTLCSPH